MGTGVILWQHSQRWAGKMEGIFGRQGGGSTGDKGGVIFRVEEVGYTEFV